jgi:hypothetical protein
MATAILVAVLLSDGTARGKDRQLILDIPDHILDLPRIESKRYPIHPPSGWDDMTYAHNLMVGVCGGRVYVAWHAVPNCRQSFHQAINGASMNQRSSCRSPRGRGRQWETV